VVELTGEISGVNVKSAREEEGKQRWMGLLIQ